MDDISLLEFMDRFGTEEACRAWLEEARWPEGVGCPRCEGFGARRLKSRPRQFRCGACGHRFSVTSGTPLHGTHLSLRTWMLAFYLMVTSTKGVSARRLSQWLGIQYRSAWHLGHRIRALMAENPEFARKLEGVVEADETYVGGPPRRVNRGPRRPRGQLSPPGATGSPACWWPSSGPERPGWSSSPPIAGQRSASDFTGG